MPPAPGTVRLFLDIRELETFPGEQFHASTYPGPEYLAGKRVPVVGGGASAVQFLGELAYRSELLWVTRRPPQWVSGSIDGLKAVEWVEERAVSGAAPASVVSSTGLFLRPQEQYARKMGVYEKRLPMFAHIEPDGVRWAMGILRKRTLSSGSRDSDPLFRILRRYICALLKVVLRCSA